MKAYDIKKVTDELKSNNVQVAPTFYSYTFFITMSFSFIGPKI